MTMETPDGIRGRKNGKSQQLGSKPPPGMSTQLPQLAQCLASSTCKTCIVCTWTLQGPNKAGNVTESTGLLPKKSIRDTMPYISTVGLSLVAAGTLPSRYPSKSSID